MPDPTKEAIDALVGPATPQFAYQLRARIEELVMDLPEDDPVRRYGEEKMELLDRLGHASSRAETGGRVRRDVPGWNELPSSAPADAPLTYRPAGTRPGARHGDTPRAAAGARTCLQPRPRCPG